MKILKIKAHIKYNNFFYIQKDTGMSHYDY